MCFNLIHSILSKARPQSAILKSLKEDLESMMQEWYMSDTKCSGPKGSKWPTWKELAPKLIEESQHA